MRVPTASQEDLTTGVTPAAPWRVKEVTALPGYRLRVRFRDGTEGEVDLSSLVNREDAGVFAPLRDPIVFEQVAVHLGAVTWPGKVDLAPDAMYDEIKKSGQWVI